MCIKLTSATYYADVISSQNGRIILSQLSWLYCMMHKLTFGSVNGTNNVKIITKLGRFEHLQIAHQIDVMNLLQS